MIKTTLLVLCLSFGLSATAAENNKKNGLVLKQIMLKLSKDMSAIANAIVLEDWERVQQHADSIANHEQAPLIEKRKILQYLGDDMAQFKSFDQIVHDKSVELSEQAKKGNSDAVIKVYSEVMQGCLDCHSRFKPRIQSRFYSFKKE
ncbi:cytochrome c [Kangiella sediminilitoris]|uniref:Cytochrome C n=1 Tax=Kangiella sediminilitoris TaxID=1144748 RepID=A0A1B3B9I9_9GAMM|nr:cytochrome c [Kangiella sediminilitoris]AOE49461.1 hypothetical protein KS2013_737 [Kangiella sediminilitoris]